MADDITKTGKAVLGIGHIKSTLDPGFQYNQDMITALKNPDIVEAVFPPRKLVDIAYDEDAADMFSIEDKGFYYVIDLPKNLQLKDPSDGTRKFYAKMIEESRADLIFGLFGVLEARTRIAVFGESDVDRPSITILPPPELNIFAVDADYIPTIEYLTQLSVARSVSPLYVCKIAKYEKCFPADWLENERPMLMFQSATFSGRILDRDIIDATSLFECVLGEADKDLAQLLLKPREAYHRLFEASRNIWKIVEPTRFSELFALAAQVTYDVRDDDTAAGARPIRGDQTISGISPIGAGTLRTRLFERGGDAIVPRKYVVMGHYLHWVLSIRLQCYYARHTDSIFSSLVFDKETAWLNAEFMKIFDQLRRLRHDLTTVVKIEVELNVITTNMGVPSLNFYFMWEDCGKPGLDTMYDAMRSHIESDGDVSRKQRYSDVLAKLG